MPRTTAPSTNPRILSGYAPYANHKSKGGSAPTTEGRRQLLLDDPHARDVQPEQVTCTRCSKTIRLQKGKQYHLAHWLDHRWRCDRVTTNPPQRSRCLTLLDRKALLEADEDAKVIEPDRVVCGKCNREVKLRKGRAYGLSCWNQHKTICQMPTYLPVSSRCGSTSHLISHSGTEAHKYTPLTYDPLVASIESQIIKCALCLSQTGVRPLKDMDVDALHRHHISCVVDNLTAIKLGWTHPRFFRDPLHRFTSGLEVIDNYISDSPNSDNVPPSLRTLSKSAAEKVQNQTSSGKQTPISDAENDRSPSPSLSPPSLSSSIPTSSNNSVASTPQPSPRRGPSLFPNSRYLPLPTPAWARERYVRDEREINVCALELRLSPLRSGTPGSDRSSGPPPYLERTPLSLPVPKGYWRFESLD